MDAGAAAEDIDQSLLPYRIQDHASHFGIGLEAEIKASVVVLMGVVAEYDKGHLEIEVLSQIQGALEGGEKSLVFGPEGEANVVVVFLWIMNLILSAVHIDVEDIGIFSKEVPGAVPEMGIDIHDEEA